MADSWFSAETAQAFQWLALLSFFSLLGPYAALGRRRKLVTATWLILLAFGCVCLVAAIAAVVVGQPGHVIKPLAVSGVVITVIFAGLYGTLQRAYQEAELRRMSAQDLSDG